MKETKTPEKIEAMHQKHVDAAQIYAEMLGQVCHKELYGAYAEKKSVSQFQTPSGTRPTVDKIEGPSRSEARPILDEIEA